MGNVREKKTETIVIRTTPSRKKQLKEAQIVMAVGFAILDLENLKCQMTRYYI